MENDLSGRTSEEDTHRKEREEATRLRIRKEQEEKFALSKKVRLSEFQSLLSEIKTQSDDGKRFQTEYDSNNPRRQRLYQLADDAVQIKTLDDFFGKYDENLAMFRDMRFKSRDQFYIRRVCESNTEYVNIRKELSKAKEKLGNSGNVRGIGLPILLFPCLMIPLYWAVVNARSTGADTVTQWMGMFIFCTCLLAAGTVFVPFCFSDGQKEEKDSGNSIVPALLALVLGSIPAMIAFFVIMNKLINKAKSYQDNLDLSSIVTSMPSWWKYVVIVLAVLISVFAAFIGGIKAAVVMLIICYIAWRYIPSGGASILPATMRQVMDPFLKYCLYACLVCFALRMVVVFRRIIKSSKYKSAAKKIQEYTSQENRIRGEIYTDIYEKYRPYMDESYLLGWSELISLRNEELVE